ncbi:NAD(P)-dependent oxidoreductase [Candidatus Gottesmanbacteria bacterium]|nr:NAD(P)-dependent oxidoreductase [Candidatus Gottesmanbacteria bacterium]
MNLLGTGLSGLVGSRIVELLSSEFHFEDLSLDTGVDITDKDIVNERIVASNAPWLIHFAAKTDVEGAEKERIFGEKSSAWRVNVTATRHIVEACKRANKRLLYISTDYVFDGTKDVYREDDIPNPQGWYAVTKYEGEKLVASLGEYGLIIRIANPYRAIFPAKPDFVAKIRTMLEEGRSMFSPDDQIFVPTFIDDIARAVKKLIVEYASGVYHVVGSTALTPYEAATLIARTFGFDESRIIATSFQKYFHGRAPRPFRAALKNDKISKFGVRMSTFAEGLAEVKKQL